MASTLEYDKGLNDDESTTSLLASSDSDSTPFFSRQPARRPEKRFYYLAFILVLLLTNGLNFYLTRLYTLHIHRSIAEPPSGAPSIFRNLRLPPRPAFLNTTFYDHDHSIYRQHASVEADLAWDHLAPQAGGVFFVKKEDAAHDGIDSERHAFYDAPELGIEGYPVVIEAMHQVHCLNVLRKNLYFNYEFYAAQARAKCPEENTPHCGIPGAYYEMHIDHCVDFLRHRLMCTTDLGIVPLMWLGREGRITGDMGRMHMCRDYEAARDFIAKESKDLPKVGSIKPKPNDPVIWDYI